MPRARGGLRLRQILIGWVRRAEIGGVGVTASLDRGDLPTKVEVSKHRMGRLDLERYEVRPNWSCTIGPVGRYDGTGSC